MCVICYIRCSCMCVCVCNTKEPNLQRCCLYATKRSDPLSIHTPISSGRRREILIVYDYVLFLLVVIVYSRPIVLYSPTISRIRSRRCCLHGLYPPPSQLNSHFFSICTFSCPLSLSLRSLWYFVCSVYIYISCVSTTGIFLLSFV